jgi:hypothetical protein
MIKKTNGIAHSAKPRNVESKYQIKDSELETDRGKAVGIGRVKIPKMIGFSFEMPLLSFVVISEIENYANKKRTVFIASCIHLGIDGCGNTDDEAIRDMIRNVCRFLHDNFCNSTYKNTRWSNILRLFKANALSSSLWDKYHTIQLMFAERGFTTDSYAILQKKIDALNAEVKRLEKETEKEKIKKAMNFEFVISKINENEVEKNTIVALYKKPQISFLPFNQVRRRIA